ncbi:hypothetical protein ACQVP2_25850 [Methylobacterium aquaticum]|uniref:hypothetical protein n=1 Tax=Methylobacterium aquaticum TaxID=270351 RepID=UPI003D17937B
MFYDEPVSTSSENALSQRLGEHPKAEPNAVFNGRWYDCRSASSNGLSEWRRLFSTISASIRVAHSRCRPCTKYAVLAWASQAAAFS